MKDSTWCRWAAFNVGILLLVAPATASDGLDPRPDTRDCASVPAESVQTPRPSCVLPDEDMDVIRIPPVVILADRPFRQFENRHNPEFRKYLKQVRKRIDQEKAYPFTAQQMRWEGSAMITFTVSPLGELLHTRIDRTSGFLILDEAAETAVKKAFPVVPPKDLFDHPMEFKVPVTFELH
ncbi:MAG: energy transducer TonB [Nitrospirota bacterium]